MTTNGEAADPTELPEENRPEPEDQSEQENRAGPPDAAEETAEAEDPALVARRNELIRDEARRNIEAIVLVSQDPAEPGAIAELLGRPVELVEEICDELTDWYEEHDRGFQLVRVAGGYRYQTHPDQANAVKRFVLDGQAGKLSPAALETLAIVAYKQPVSRAQVAAIRGVGVDSVMRTLQQRGYIEEIARDPGPGQAVLYGTTTAFLEKLGLDHLDEMPSLGAFVPAPEVLEALEHSLRIESSAGKASSPTGDDGAESATPGTPDTPSDTPDTPSDTPDTPSDAVADGTPDSATDVAIADVIDLRPRPHVS